MIREQLLDIETELNTQFIDRNEEIRGMLLALLSKQHILLLGPPGTAKSALCTAWSKAVEGRFFRRLINQYSTPDELFGPVDLPAYKNEGVFRRILRGKAADSELILLDEVFKGGPAILNTLLSLMEERIFDNDGQVVKAPLQTLIGASNELPSEDDGLAAFYDRFLFRFMSTYLDTTNSFRLMLETQTSPLVNSVTLEELAHAQLEVALLAPLPSTLDAMEMVMESLNQEEIRPSDRRYKYLLRAMAADSWLSGYSQVMPESLLVAKDILWSKPQEYVTVQRIVRSCINPAQAKAQEIEGIAQEAMDVFHAQEYMSDQEKLQILQQLKGMQEELRGLGLDPDNTTLRISETEAGTSTFRRLQLWIAELMASIAG